MKNFNLTFYFEGKKQEVKVSAEQLGLNFGLGKILADLSDGTNAFSEKDKALAEFQKENNKRTEEYSKLLEENDIVWEHDGKKYFIVIPVCDDAWLEIYNEDREYVVTVDYHFTLID